MAASLQWTLITSFLYLETGVVVLLLLPIISARTWNKLFKSSFMRGLGERAHIFFYTTVGVLIICLYDAISQMWKFDTHCDGKEKGQCNSTSLFRAQRNFYITSFSLFLVFVIRRLTLLIANQATLSAINEAVLRQAEAASRTATDLMSKKDVEKEQPGKASELAEQLRQLKEDLEKAKKERDSAVKDLDAIKSQSEGTKRDYDRLVEEHSKLQKKYIILGGEDFKSDKKAD